MSSGTAAAFSSCRIPRRLRGSFITGLAKSAVRVLAAGQRAVSCYVSTDLVHWTFKTDVMTLNAADFANGLILELAEGFL